MARDNILEEAKNAEQSDDHDPEPDPQTEGDRDPDEGSDTTDQNEDPEILKFSTRMPADLVEDVERVQEDIGLPSRNAAINFLLKRTLEDR